MPAKRVKQFLDENHVKYVSIHHSPAFTAQEIAASAHISGREFAKTVVVKIDGITAMAVLPASLRLDLDAFRDAVGADEVRLATEDEFESLFPGCELGAMPPFGNLFGLDVFVASCLSEEKSIVFNAGTHQEALRLDYADFARLVQPRTMVLVQNLAALH